MIADKFFIPDIMYYLHFYIKGCHIYQLSKKDEPPCYVMQAVVCANCLGDKCLLHAKLISTSLTQLLIFRFSYLLTNKGIAQHTDNSN